MTSAAGRSPDDRSPEDHSPTAGRRRLARLTRRRPPADPEPLSSPDCHARALAVITLMRHPDPTGDTVTKQQLRLLLEDCDRQTLGNILLSAGGIADGLSRQLAAAVGDEAVEHYLHQTGLRLAQT